MVATKKFTVLSSNIRFSTPNDGVQAWSNRLPLISQRFNQLNPLVIATQEGRRPQLNELALKLKDYQLVDQHRHWIEERMYPCLFVNKALSKIISSGDIWLSQTPHLAGSKSFGSAFPRLCTWCHLQLIESQRQIFIINLHLDHLHSETRAKQIEVLVQEIESIRIKEIPLVLMGDFNEGPEQAVRQYITSKWKNIYDPWDREEETSYHKFQGHLENGARIDWIMLDDSLKCHEIELDKFHSNGIFLSDHFPVICKFSFED